MFISYIVKLVQDNMHNTGCAKKKKDILIYK